MAHPLQTAADEADARFSEALARRGRNRWDYRNEDGYDQDVQAALQAKLAADEMWLAVMREEFLQRQIRQRVA